MVENVAEKQKKHATATLTFQTQYHLKAYNGTVTKLKYDRLAEEFS